MTTRGGIVAVRTEPLGDQLAAATIIGATSITVYDTADFEETQGVLQIGAEVVGYSVADDETGVITLSTPLAAAYALDDPVLAYPLGTTTTAEVVVEDGGDPISARVPHALVPMLPDGVRSGADETEAVDLERVGLEWLVSDVVGKTPITDASYTDPGTLPGESFIPPDPPAESPQPIVRAFSVLALDAEWDQEPGATEYDVFVSPTAGFTADGSTYFGTVTATHVVITTDPTTGARLLVQPYFVKTIARAVNPAGSAQAAPSLEGSATPRQASTDEISALWAYLGDVEAQQIRSGSLDADVVIGGSIKTAGLDVSGNQVYPYWTADGNGARAYGPGGASDIRWLMPNDPALTARTTGVSELDRLKTALSASLAGTTTFEKGGTVVFATGFTAPSTDPAVTPAYQTLTTGAGSGTYHGLFSFDSTYWGTFREAFGDLSTQSSTFVKIHKTTGAITDAWSLNQAGFKAYGGGLIFGGFVYVLGRYDPGDAPARAGEWWVLKYSTAGVKQAAEWRWRAAGTYTGQSYPALGAWLTTDLVIAYQILGGASANKVFVARYVADTGADPGGTSTFTTASALPVGSGVGSANYQPFDYGSNRLLITPYFAATAGTMLATTAVGSNLSGTGDTFPLPTTGVIVGVTYDGTQFQTLASGGILYKHSTIMWTSGSNTFWVSNTFRDADAGGTGTHESMEGPRASLTMIQRAFLTMSVSGVPDTGNADDPNTVSFYAARKSTAPARTEMWLQSAPSAPAVDGGPVSATVGSLATSGTNPPSTSNFPGSVPTQAQTATGEVMFSGDGTSSWAPVGSIVMWPMPAVPTGWLALDGSNVSRTVYARLFAVLGIAYGAGDGSTTFGLPDMRSRVPIGGGTFRALGADEGQSETNRSPRHTHPAGTLAAGTTADRAAGGLGRANTTITGNTGLTDTGTPFPSLGLTFIIKV